MTPPDAEGMPSEKLRALAGLTWAEHRVRQARETLGLFNPYDVADAAARDSAAFVYEQERDAYERAVARAIECDVWPPLTGKG